MESRTDRPHAPGGLPGQQGKHLVHESLGGVDAVVLAPHHRGRVDARELSVVPASVPSRHDLAATTRYDYACQIRLHIKPLLGRTAAFNAAARTSHARLTDAVDRPCLVEWALRSGDSGSWI